MESILSYPDRGQGGSNKYRGNCTPKLIEDLIRFYNWKDISDYMCGSGTTQDAANKLNITSHCYDLHMGFNLLDQDIPERNEAIFWHPPYWDLIRYSDNMYSSRNVLERYGIDPADADLSRCKTWDDFVKKMNYCCLKQYTSLEKGGRMAILMGDIRRHGNLYSMLLNIAKPGSVENILIKVQHNCHSDRYVYTSKFIKIVHEYVLILRKDSALIYPVQMPVQYTQDIRDIKAATWKDVVASIFEEYGNPLRLDQIYEAIENYGRAKNKYWKEKVRQTLQLHKLFASEQRGIWRYTKAD